MGRRHDGRRRRDGGSWRRRNGCTDTSWFCPAWLLAALALPGGSALADDLSACTASAPTALSQRIASCSRVIASDRAPPAAYLARGQAYRMKADYGDAIEDFDAVIDMDAAPALTAEALLGRGAAFAARGSSERPSPISAARWTLACRRAGRPPPTTTAVSLMPMPGISISRWRTSMPPSGLVSPAPGPTAIAARPMPRAVTMTWRSGTMTPQSGLTGAGRIISPGVAGRWARPNSSTARWRIAIVPSNSMPGFLPATRGAPWPWRVPAASRRRRRTIAVR